MMKWLGMLLALCVALGACSASAEEEAHIEAPEADETAEMVNTRLEMRAGRPLMLTGTVTAGRTVPVLAPFGGMLEEVFIRKGDFIGVQASLFTIQTTKVYAPCDGVVGSLNAQPGDEAAFLQERYGALLYLEPSSQFLIHADTKNAHTADENQIIHVGETVYIGSRSAAERVGTGRVISVNGKNYTVEVTDGSLVLDDNVVIYRDAAFAAESKIGTGKTVRNTAVSVTGSGVLFAVHAAQGQKVRRGDLLLETVTGQTAYNPYPTNKVISGYTAVVASVDAGIGSAVAQNQVLATLYPVEDFQITVSAAEPDLADIAVGDTVRAELTNFFNEPSFLGTVVAVSGLSDTSGDEPEYEVTIAFKAGDLIRPGMNVNVYFNEW